ncbi:hypothetical protein EYF80_033415 [Liparis tanakae]|uniref:Uncharacterized protein n=1 Tax=Liparis tanakae TaxID=230148 RepID=A0A4Z2GSL5_9TELE|nr:hypothetical protein EYF80_033415 [Liparis tanakae]
MNDDRCQRNTAIVPPWYLHGTSMVPSWYLQWRRDASQCGRLEMKVGKQEEQTTGEEQQVEKQAEQSTEEEQKAGSHRWGG